MIADKITVNTQFVYKGLEGRGADTHAFVQSGLGNEKYWNVGTLGSDVVDGVRQFHKLPMQGILVEPTDNDETRILYVAHQPFPAPAVATKPIIKSFVMSFLDNAVPFIANGL